MALTVFKKLPMNAFNVWVSTTRPTVMLTAKPIENMFNWGAALVITPNVKLTTSIVQQELIAIANALMNMTLPKVKISFKPAGGRKAPPIGILS